MTEQEAAYEAAQEYLLIAEEKYEYQKRRTMFWGSMSGDADAKALQDTRRLVARARTEELIARNALVDAMEADSLAKLGGTDADEDERRWK